MATLPPAGSDGTRKETIACLTEPSGQRCMTFAWVAIPLPAITACGQLAISPCANGRPIRTGWLASATPAFSVTVIDPAAHDKAAVAAMPSDAVRRHLAKNRPTVFADGGVRPFTIDLLVRL